MKFPLRVLYCLCMILGRLLNLSVSVLIFNLELLWVTQYNCWPVLISCLLPTCGKQSKARNKNCSYRHSPAITGHVTSCFPLKAEDKNGFCLIPELKAFIYMERRDGSHLSEGISSLFISQHENAVHHLVGNKTGNLRPAAASVPRRCCPLLETPFSVSHPWCCLQSSWGGKRSPKTEQIAMEGGRFRMRILKVTSS